MIHREYRHEASLSRKRRKRALQPLLRAAKRAYLAELARVPKKPINVRRGKHE